MRLSHLYATATESNSSFIWESVNNQKAIYLFRPTFLFSAAADDADRLCHDYFCIRLYKLVTYSQLTLTLVKDNHCFQFGLPKSVTYILTQYLRICQRNTLFVPVSYFMAAIKKSKQGNEIDILVPLKIIKKRHEIHSIS